MSDLLRDFFPGLRTTFFWTTSPADPDYNCIAWAANDTSKLGKLEDIEHDLRAMEGDIYGSVALVLKRPMPPV